MVLLKLETCFLPPAFSFTSHLGALFNARDQIKIAKNLRFRWQRLEFRLSWSFLFILSTGYDALGQYFILMLARGFV